jgi:hypothetical protein
MAIGREDKGFQQFDWWRVIVCLFNFHTRGQQPPKCLHGSTFWEFWGQHKVCLQYLWKPKLSSSGQTFLSKLMQTPLFVYLNGLLLCPLEGNLYKVLLT